MNNQFYISTDSLFYFYKAIDHSECKAHLVDFLRQFGVKKRLLDLYTEFLSRSAQKEYLQQLLPDQAEWNHCVSVSETFPQQIFLGSANQREIMNQLLNTPDITQDGRMIEYHFERSSVNGDYLPMSALVLNQEVTVEYQDERQRPFFAYFFSFMFGHTAFPKEFLEYHLSQTFQADIKQFADFLMTINYGSRHAKEGYVDLMKSWLKEKKEELKRQSLDQTFTETFKGLADIIPSPHHYAYLVRELSKLGYLDRSGGFIYTGKDRVATAIALLETFVNHQFTNPAISWTVDMKSRFLKEAWGLTVSPTSSSFRSMLAKQRKRFASLAMASQITA